MENETNNVVESGKVTMSMADIRRAICGEMEFTISINKNVDIMFRELTQTDLDEIDNEMDKRGIAQYIVFSKEDQEKISKGELQTDFVTKEYKNMQKVLKLTWAFIKMVMNGKEIQMQDESGKLIEGNDRRIYVEKLIVTLGEGTWTGLYLQYEGTVSQKFLDVKKKSLTAV